MSAEIPQSHVDLLTGETFVALTTLMPSGKPQTTPIWIDWDGEYVLVNTARGRVKAKNMEARPWVSVLAIDPKNPYRWLEVRGDIADSTEAGAVEHIDRLSWRYDKHSYYTGGEAESRKNQTRVLFKIRPMHVTARG